MTPEADPWPLGSFLLSKQHQDACPDREQRYNDASLAEIEPEGTAETDENEIDGEQNAAEVAGDFHMGGGGFRMNQVFLLSAINSTIPPTMAMAPTMGGMGNVWVFSAVTWIGPRLTAFSVVVYVKP